MPGYRQESAKALSFPQSHVKLIRAAHAGSPQRISVGTARQKPAILALSDCEKRDGATMFLRDTLNELRDVRTWVEVVVIPTALFGLVCGIAALTATVGG